jgi:hypothetical protein
VLNKYFVALLVAEADRWPEALGAVLGRAALTQALDSPNALACPSDDSSQQLLGHKMPELPVTRKVSFVRLIHFDLFYLLLLIYLNN